MRTSSAATRASSRPVTSAATAAPAYDDLGEKYFVAAGLMRELELEPGFHDGREQSHWDTIGEDAPQYPEGGTGLAH